VTESVQAITRFLQAVPCRNRALLTFVCLFACTSAYAALYKWTDASGKIHYSDQPPIIDTQSLKSSHTGQAEATSQATKSLNAKDQEYQKRRKDEDEARAKADAEAERMRVKRENCTRARNALDTLQNTPRVYSTNAAGQRVYLDDAARASAQASAQKSVSENCQ
jgi:hypothetical protein